MTFPSAVELREGANRISPMGCPRGHYYRRAIRLSLATIAMCGSPEFEDLPLEEQDRRFRSLIRMSGKLKAAAIERGRLA